MNKTKAKLLVNKTKDDYDLIADHFDQTRSYLPADILAVAKLAVDGDKVLDAGCGNGRLVECFKVKVDYIGIDNSSTLLNISQERYPNHKFLLVDNLDELKFEDDYFDKIYCLAVFHHIPSGEMRINVLRELFRVLKMGGKLYLSVWDLTSRKDYADIVTNAKPSIENGHMDNGDLLVPFNTSSDKVLRYVHQFSEIELKDLIVESGFLVESVSHTRRGTKPGQNNIQFICQKL